MDNAELKTRTEQAVAGSQAVAVRTKAEEARDYVTRVLAPQLDEVLRRNMSTDRFMRIVLNAFRTKPELMQCSLNSIGAALMNCAALNLEPNTPMGYCYLIPRRNQGTMEANLQIAYKGYMELARRSGEIIDLYADVVYEGDFFEHQQGRDASLTHVSKFATKTPQFAYAYAHLKGGGFVFRVLPIEQVDALSMRGARGRGKKTPWDTDYEAMCRKTAIHQLKPWLPMSEELKHAFEVDEDPAMPEPHVEDAVETELPSDVTED